MKTKIILLTILLIASFLRLYKLSEVPVSLFGDELDVGYHAYSILKTGKDYSGNVMPLHFQSFAEFRTPIYLYASVPTVALFGISALGVRLPAALFGILGIWAMYLLVKEMLNAKLQMLNKDQSKGFTYEVVALVSAAMLAVSPWHIQYSRAGFEVTMFLAFLIFGLYFFFRALKSDGKWLWLSGSFLVLTPLIYSTAKLFTPMLILFLVAVWFKDIRSLCKKSLIVSSLFIVLLGLPTIYSTLFSGGTQRFNYISVFSDPAIEQEVGGGRLTDAFMRKEIGPGLTPTFTDKAFHNKVVFWADRISTNYLQSFSTEFLFNEGDPNLRHSIKGVGQFYKIEFFALLLGLIFFFTYYNRHPELVSGTASFQKRQILTQIRNDENKMRLFIAFWIFAGVIPAAITRDGGNHATRLILILPPLVFLMSYGLVTFLESLSKNFKFICASVYYGLWILSFGFYMHSYWIHNPVDSERWWHSGWEEAVQAIKQEDQNYDKVIISMAGEPAWIFFAGWYEYDPVKWHAGFPFKKETINGFGEMSYTDKYYFGSFHPPIGGIYDLPKYLETKTLYVADAKEIGANLIQEPLRVPTGLTLVKAVAFPSGEPAFYLFSRQE